MITLLWIGFIAFVIVMLALDLGVFHREARTTSATEGLRWTFVCVVLALLFNVLIYFMYAHQFAGLGADPAFPLTGKQAALQFFTAWLIEQTLSLDNVFVIAIIFSYFKVPLQYQHRVLFWGIVGALLMRGLMIAFGAALIHNFDWVHYVFGALLVYAAVKILLVKEEEMDPRKNMLFRLVHRLYPVSAEYDGQKFFTVQNGRRMATPLLLVLLVIESSDVLFAIDSIPAVFAITQDPFLVFTSNIFAILSLRSLYFALASIMDKFAYLKLSLVFILLFVGLKMVLTHHYPISTELSFAVVFGLLSLGMMASVVRKRLKGPIAQA